jgi:outer membrane protein assembly factor BamB
MSAAVLIGAAAQTPASKTPPPTQKTFERQWNHAIAAPGQLGIAAGPERVFVTDDQNGIEARGVADGALAWRASLPSDLPAAPAGDQVFVVSGGQLHALEEATGRVRWSRPLDPPCVALVRHETGVITAGGIVVRAWSADGSVAWERRLAAAAGRELLAIDGGQLYLGLTDLTLVALDVSTGAPKWTEPIETVPVALTAAGGKVYFGGTDRNLHAYDRNGGRDWTYHRMEVVGAPVVDSRHLYATLMDNTVVAHTKNNGHIQWRRQLDDRPARGPSLAGPFVVTILQSDVVVVMPTAPDKADPAPTGQLPTTPAQAAPARNRVKVATSSADGSQIFAVIQLENQDRVLVAYKGS